MVAPAKIPTRRQVENELARRQLRWFMSRTFNHELHQWQILLCSILDRLVTEQGLRLLIHGPPQFGKSIILSKRTPAYLLGRDPLRRIILGGYNVTHSRTQFAEPVRNLMISDTYREIFPDTQLPAVTSVEAFSTLQRARLNDGQDSIVALGIQSGYTGKGAGPGDCVFLDDPYASPDEARSLTINAATLRFWDDTLEPRTDPLANVVVMFHRYHDRDLAAHLQEQGGWEYIRFPAIADANEDGSDPTGRQPGEPLSSIRPLWWLEDKRDKDPQTFASLFQGRPRPDAGGLFQEEDFIVEDQAPALKLWVRYWDVAAKAKQSNDRTAGALVGVDELGCIWIKHVAAWRREWPESRDGLRDPETRTVRTDPVTGDVIDPGIVDIALADVRECKRLGELLDVDAASYLLGIESKSIGIPMFQDLQMEPKLLGVPLFGIDPGTKDKKQRASGWAARARSGKLRLVKGPWNKAFINECLAFRGDGLTHDDQVDAVSGAFELLYRHIGETLGKPETKPAGSLAYYRELAGRDD